MSEAIDSSMREERRFAPVVGAHAHVGSMEEYRRLYRESIEAPEAFWGRVGRELHWFKPWSKVLEWKGPDAKWYVGGQTNLAYNCLERQIHRGLGDEVAIVFEGEPLTAGGRRKWCGTPIGSCWRGCVRWPTRSRPWGLGGGMWSRFTCR